MAGLGSFLGGVVALLFCSTEQRGVMTGVCGRGRDP